MRLHEQVKHQAEIIAEYKAGINELQRYIASAKFDGFDGVNPADIKLRLDELQRYIDRLE
jgi:hypothetical protein